MCTTAVVHVCEPMFAPRRVSTPELDFQRRPFGWQQVKICRECTERLRNVGAVTLPCLLLGMRISFVSPGDRLQAVPAVRQLISRSFWFSSSVCVGGSTHAAESREKNGETRKRTLPPAPPFFFIPENFDRRYQSLSPCTYIVLRGHIPHASYRQLLVLSGSRFCRQLLVLSGLRFCAGQVAGSLVPTWYVNVGGRRWNCMSRPLCPTHDQPDRTLPPLSRMQRSTTLFVDNTIFSCAWRQHD